MKKIFLISFILIAACFLAAESSLFTTQNSESADNISINDQAINTAFANRQSNVHVQCEAVVKTVLADDNQGGRHQRFIVQLASGQTLLIAHNIDISGRIESIKKGDRVTINGEYEWNPQGGVIHWTHHDPSGRHLSGWVKHDGQTYQ
jgi:hypothetical protein